MRIVTLSQETPVHRYVFHTFHHPANIEDSRRASSCICTVSWTSSASYHIANAPADGIYVLLRRYHVYMGVKMTWSTYGMLASSSLGACRDYHVGRYFVHCVWVACTSNSSNLAIFYANVAFYYSKYRIEDNRVCNHKIKSTVRVGDTWRLCQSVPYCLSSTKDNLISK